MVQIFCFKNTLNSPRNSFDHEMSTPVNTNRHQQRLVTGTIIKTMVVLACWKISDFISNSVSTPVVEKEAICIFDKF